MFLKRTLEKNKNLIKTCVDLHQKGLIPSNSFVIDIDTFKHNASIIYSEGKKYNLKVFAMTKQIGRCPSALFALKDSGIDTCVCVDMADARAVNANGMKIGHLGHLVQVPMQDTLSAVEMQPLFWTVYNIEKAESISKYLNDGDLQNIMLRVYDDGDTFYKGHGGGFHISEIEHAAKKIEAMKGLRVAGLTTFPTQLFNDEKKIIEHTHNYNTLFNAKEILEKNGFSNLELNAPGTTCSMLFEHMAKDGITQVEPGHGLTGTTPLHAIKDLPEMPAMVYVSEVSHIHAGKPYCFGGGMYIDPVFPEYDVKACVGRDESAIENLVSCDIPNPSAIDYYGILNPDLSQKVQIGDTAVFGFRGQTFVTRAYMVGVSGISSGNIKVDGIFSTDGRKIGWPKW